MSMDTADRRRSDSSERPASEAADPAGAIYEARSSRTVACEGAELYVSEVGDANRPTLVLVHGYPDTHRVWDELVELLSDRFHVVAYDVRGFGRSTAPPGDRAYAVERLARDLEAVVDAVSPDEPVHLVGHDWGAFQCWEALAGGGLGGRVASFTAVAGPRIDQAAAWTARRLRASPAALAQLAGQARRSWYIGAFQLPGLADRAVPRVMERVWPTIMRRLEGIEPRPGHPAATLASDARVGIALYRTNMRRYARTQRPGRVEVPVQLIVPTRDRYISTALYNEAAEWGNQVWRRDIRAGHWVQRSHPARVASHVSEFVDYAQDGVEKPALRRARWGAQRLPLEGRLAVVTGAGSGIGRATVLALARGGADVIAADVDLETARKTSGAAADGQVQAMQVDVGEAAAMEGFARDVEREHGVPSIVVNNAGIGIGGPFLDTTLADWERIIDVNLWGVIHGSRLFAAQMAQAGVEGHIVNVASAAAFTPSRMLPAYSTTKAAVLMLSECMRAELADYGIAVSAICPGFVNTNIVRTSRIVGASSEQERRLKQRGVRALGLRGYPPERVAEAIVKALDRNPALLPVTPEARVMLTLSQLSPAVVRRLAKADPGRLAR